MQDKNGQLFLFPPEGKEIKKKRHYYKNPAKEKESQLYLFHYEGKDCPPYFANPKNDNEMLLNYQHDYLVYKDESAWKNLWLLTSKVAERIINAQRKQKGFFLSAFDKEDILSKSTMYLLRRYKTKSGYMIKENFISAIKKSVIHALYYRTKADCLIEFMENEAIERSKLL